MLISFDDQAADLVVTEAGAAASTLRDQGPSRRGAVEVACDEFSGNYARLFEVACSVESQDRLKLAGVLEGLVRQVGEAKTLAKRENDRLAELQAWQDRDDRRRRDDLFGFQGLGASIFDPKPSESPVAAPTISAAFIPQQRTRGASQSHWGGTTSADPVDLRGFVRVSQDANSVLGPALSAVRTAWSGFVSACSWVRFGTTNFVAGFGDYLGENRSDVAWIKRVAQAFEDAGSGQISDFELSLSVAAGDPEYLTALLGSDDLTVEQVGIAVAYLSAYPHLALHVGGIVAGEVRELNLDSGRDDIDRVAALLNGFARKDLVSKAILTNLGGEGMIQALSLIGDLGWSLGGSEESGRLAVGLREVFRRGESVMTEADSRKLARELVAYLRSDDRLDSSFSSNDPFALSYLLRDSVLSTPFLGELGNELDAFERAWTGGDGMWERLTMNPVGIGAFFDEDASGAAFDPMTSYMSALGLNGEAALQFFAGTGGLMPLGPTEAFGRQEYWIERRLWGHDDFNGLLAALDAATTSPGHTSDPQAIGLTSTAVEMLANRTRGVNFAGDKISFPSEDEKILPGTLGVGASTHLAHILGTYMESVEYSVYHDWTPSESRIGRDRSIERAGSSQFYDMPVFHVGDLRVLIKAGASTDDGFAAFRQALTNYQDVHFDQVIRNHYGNDNFQSVLNNATNHDARLEAFFIKNVGEASIAEGLSEDERIKTWVNLASDLAGRVPISMIPGVGPLAGFLSEQALDVGTDSLAQHLIQSQAHNAEDAVITANDLASDSLAGRRNSIVGSLYNNGVISRADVDALASRMGHGGQVDAWFADGFPDSKTIRSDTDLQDLVIKLAEDRVDMNEYKQNYENEFRKYFE